MRVRAWTRTEPRGPAGLAGAPAGHPRRGPSRDDDLHRWPASAGLVLGRELVLRPGR